MTNPTDTPRQLPLGIADFERMRRQHYYYVDKTMYIPKLEFSSSYLFFVRPRRFGKSLLLSMLRAYYDINMADKFDEYFGDLWIGSHPTALRNSYAVLHLDFSQVTGGIENLRDSFDSYCGIIVDSFAEEYERLFYNGFAADVKREDWATKKLNFIGAKARQYRVPLYLIVDEYDNFTNTVLNQHGEDIYRGLTHGEGFYRDIFKIFKPNFERVLMIGVSPVTMDDLTSGYNIATNITARSEFNQMLGFSEDDVRQMFQYYHQLGWLKGDVEAMISEMKPWYDGYCFAKDSLDRDSKMFNTDMVLYYLGSQIRFGHSPDSMLNPNARTDYQKMKNLIQLDKLEKGRKSVIYEIAEKGGITGQLVGYFPASEMVTTACSPLRGLRATNCVLASRTTTYASSTTATCSRSTTAYALPTIRPSTMPSTGPCSGASGSRCCSSLPTSITRPAPSARSLRANGTYRDSSRPI